MITPANMFIKNYA